MISFSSFKLPTVGLSHSRISYMPLPPAGVPPCLIFLVSKPLFTYLLATYALVACFAYCLLFCWPLAKLGPLGS